MLRNLNYIFEAFGTMYYHIYVYYDDNNNTNDDRNTTTQKIIIIMVIKVCFGNCWFWIFKKIQIQSRQFLFCKFDFILICFPKSVFKQDTVFKNGPNVWGACWNFLKAVFHKFYFVYSWILYLKCCCITKQQRSRDTLS